MRNRTYMWVIAGILIAVLVLGGWYVLKGTDRGLTAKNAVVVIRADDVPYEVASAPKPGDVIIDKYNKPYFEVISATYTHLQYRGTDAEGQVIYSSDPQRYTMYVTAKTISPFYDDVPVMAKQRVVVGRTLTLEGPTWAVSGRVTKLTVTPVK
ncbi:DUF4330 domain-containing protein [Coprothermobacter platensis]|uniref:DUF4330 domain-containing protein n=1 Tax=Coprothermobacter platensis TaxID=108819 RepID=UPI00038174DD|nr:DUF4330 domain-containing protein [Coprothermobacter platensis]